MVRFLTLTVMFSRVIDFKVDLQMKLPLSGSLCMQT